MAKLINMLGWLVTKQCNTDIAHCAGLTVLDLPHYEEVCNTNTPHVAVGLIIDNLHPASVVVHDIAHLTQIYRQHTAFLQEKVAKLHKNSQLSKTLTQEPPKVLTFILD